MIAIVTGGRNYRNRDVVFAALDALQPTEVVNGGASGADALASEWAQERGVPRHVYLAEWHRYGASAGPRRNQQMIDECSADVVLAFPGGRGTADMVERAGRAGVDVRRILP